MADTRNWLLCFEYVPNGSLDKHIKDASSGLEWSKRYEIIKGICEGLRYLHDKHIIHLDLKPDNILLDDHMLPKIADFGLSRCLDENQTRVTTTRLCGSVGYLAPEFFTGRFTFASDIYSLGVIIVEILTGEKGYPEDQNVVESWMNRLEGDTQIEQIRLCTKIGIECMDYDPKKRPAAHHIVDMLGIINTGTNSSSEQGVYLRKEQHGEGRIRNTFAPEIEVVAKYQEKEDQWLIMGSQYTKQDRKDSSFFSSKSSMFQKLSNLDIFNRKSRRNFVRNGGPMIQQSNSVKIFRKEDLKSILNIENLVGRGAYGEVYGGILGNVQVVVRKPIAGSQLHNEEFANEVIERSQVIHKNILRLIGCCLEVDIPMLVYEFVSNGSLRDILLSKNKMPLNLGMRLRIAAQAADGLAYMHSKANSKVLICGLEAANILLDDKFMPKISDFGISTLRDGQLLGYFIGQPALGIQGYFVGLPAPSKDGYFVGQPALSNQGYFVGRPTPGIQGYFLGQPAPSNKGYFGGRPTPDIQGYFVGRPAPGNQGYFLGQPAPSNKGYFAGRSTPGIQGYFVGRPAPGFQGYFVGRPAPGIQGYFIAMPLNEDPIFMENNQLTQQSEVYSFGIIILELISRKDATHDDNSTLVEKFLKCHEEGKKATELFDKEIAATRDLEILDILVVVALECLSTDVDARPKMADVAERLLILSHTYMSSG
uniref:Uncharacterized protein n=1 Tax=Avena sativa TaxID=4498 RepID=A0ACD5T6M2_AVESA